MRGRVVCRSLALAAASVVLAACGSSSSGGDDAAAKPNPTASTPAAELASAVAALGDAHTVSLTFTLGASASDLLQLASGLDDGPTKAQADAISNNHIRFVVQGGDGKSLREAVPGSTEGASALTLGDDDTDYFTLKAVDGSFYGHIDLPYFLGLVNGAPSYRSLQQKVANAPAFVRDAVAGKWVSLSTSTLKSLTDVLGGQVATPKPSTLAEFRSKLLSTLLANVDVTRVSSGPTDQLDVSFELRELVSEEYAAISPILNTLVPRGADGGSPIPGLNPQNIPDVTVHFDAFVTNGALSKVVFDAGQFDAEKRVSVPIELTIAQDGPAITAPSDATPIELSDLGQLFARV